VPRLCASSLRQSARCHAVAIGCLPAPCLCLAEIGPAMPLLCGARSVAAELGHRSSLLRVTSPSRLLP
jgi:hypothetical protein